MNLFARVALLGLLLCAAGTSSASSCARRDLLDTDVALVVPSLSASGLSTQAYSSALDALSQACSKAGLDDPNSQMTVSFVLYGQHAAVRHDAIAFASHEVDSLLRDAVTQHTAVVDANYVVDKLYDQGLAAAFGVAQDAILSGTHRNVDIATLVLVLPPAELSSSFSPESGPWRTAARNLRQRRSTILTTFLRDSTGFATFAPFTSSPVHAHAVAVDAVYPSSTALSLSSKIMSVRRGVSVEEGLGNSCAVYGNSHFYTPAGTSFSFQGWGDFWLVNSPDVQVQVRKLDCLQDLEDTSYATGVSCVRALAFSTGGATVQAEYLPSANVFSWFVNEVPIPSYESVYRNGAVSATLQPIEGDGYMISVRNILSDYSITAEFTTKGSVVWVTYPSYSLNKTVSGLCGTNNGCPNEDLQYVNGTFIPDSEAVGNRGLYAFGESWRVKPADSLFLNIPAETYPEPAGFVPVFISFTGYAPQECAGLDGSAVAACSFDTSFAFSAWPALEAAFTFCAGYCEAGSGVQAPVVSPSYCRCPINDGLEMHTQYDDDNLPLVRIDSPDMPATYAQVPFGGKYTFRRGQSGPQMSVNVVCPSPVHVFPGPNLTLPITLLGPPRAQILNASIGRPLRSTDRVSWKVLTFGALTQIIYPSSLTPKLVLSAPDEAIVELAVFDGCWITRKRITITTECADCVVQSYSLLPSHTIEFSSNRFLGYFDVSGPTNLERFLEFAMPIDVAPLPGSSIKAPLELRLDAHDPTPAPWSERTVYPGGPSVTFSLVKVLRRGEIKSYGPIVTNTSSQGAISLSMTTSGDLLAEEDQVAVPHPAQLFVGFDQHAELSNYSIAMVSNQNITVIEELVEPLCSVELSANAQGTAQVYLTPLGGLPPGACEAVYNLTAFVQSSCGNNPPDQSLTFDVTCGPRPVPRVNCSGSVVQFDTDRKEYPSTRLIGRQSFGWDPNFPHVWNVTSVPKHSNIPVGVFSTELDVDFQPDTSGVFVFVLQAGLACPVVSEPVTVTAVCTQPLTISIPVIPTSSITPSGRPLRLPMLTVTASFSEPSSFMWDVIPPIQTQNPVYRYQYPTIFGRATSSVSFVPNVCGTWRLNLTATDSCTTAFATREFTIPCHDITITFPGSERSALYDWETHSFHQVLLNTSVVSSNPNSSFGSSSYAWYVDEAPDGAVTSFSPGFNPGVSHNPSLSLSEGGHYLLSVVITDSVVIAAANILVTADCAPLTVGFSPENPSVGDVLMLKATGADLYTWRLVRRPTYSIASIPAEFVSAPNANFTADVAGTYVFALETDTVGCQPEDRVQFRRIEVVFSCSSAGRGWFPPPSTDVNVAFTGSHWPSVNLDLPGGSTGPFKPEDFRYQWRFLDAPEHSVYAPKQTRGNTSTYTEQPRIIPVSPEDGLYVLHVTNTTNTTFTDRSSLVALETEAATAGCFFPDLPGTYTVEMAMIHACGVNTSRITVHAACSGVPDLHVTVTPPSGSQTVVSGLAEVTVSARGSQYNDSKTHHEAKFFWEWAQQPPSGSYEMKYLDDSTVTIVAHAPFESVLNVTITDGCSAASTSVPVRFLPMPSSKVTHVVDVSSFGYPVVAAHKLRLQPPNSGPDDVRTDSETVGGRPLCLESTGDWQLVGFEWVAPPTRSSSSKLGGGAVAGIAIGTTVAVVGAAALCFVCFARRKSDASSGSGSGSGSGGGARAAGAAGGGAGAAAAGDGHYRTLDDGADIEDTRAGGPMTGDAASGRVASHPPQSVSAVSTGSGGASQSTVHVRASALPQAPRRGGAAPNQPLLATTSPGSVGGQSYGSRQ